MRMSNDHICFWPFAGELVVSAWRSAADVENVANTDECVGDYFCTASSGCSMDGIKRAYLNLDVL